MIDMSILARYKYTEYKTNEDDKKEDKIFILLTENNLKKSNILTL
jgi:hypothetical protein